ncbi:cytochrome P450 4C1 [Halyomorpha halys]|uniref:cytochrome P450 4C1 n=1 Tax=Halyomorpha halys TaxID=286706 RepID=UPI0006D52095|nr:cytochrome P450 4C1-like [Halyomorpha halys]
MEVFLITLALGAFLIWWLLTPDKRLREMGSKIPGPRSYPIVGNIFNFNLIGTKAIENWKQCVEKYGRTFRYWLGPQLHIFISEPDDIQMLLTSKTLITKSEAYKTLESWLGTGLLISTGELWQRRRKAITPTFHFKILDEFVPTFNKCANTLVKILKDKVSQGYFPLTDFMSHCALDAVAETAMGTEINAQTNAVGEYPKSVEKMTNALMERISNPLLGMEPLYTLSGLRKKESRLLQTLFSLPIELIRRKENEKNDVQDSSANESALGVKHKTAFLEFLIKMKRDKVPAFQTEQDITDEVMTFMFEGHETTAIALAFAIWLLGKHQDVQEELYHEVSGILVGQEPTIEDYQKMTYLERVLKETIRLYPSVPLIGRMAMHDVVLPTSGYIIPKGAYIDINIYATHRREDLFTEPDMFNPDRYFEPQKHPYAYIPFSAGIRNCIGQKFAMLEMKVIASNLVLNYKIESDEVLIMSPEMLFRTKKGPNVRLTSRN